MEELKKLGTDIRYIDILHKKEDDKILAKLEGEERGLKEGRKEEKMEIVKAMLENDVDISDIAKYVKLDVKEIEKLAGIC